MREEKSFIEEREDRGAFEGGRTIDPSGTS